MVPGRWFLWDYFDRRIFGLKEFSVSAIVGVVLLVGPSDGVRGGSNGIVTMG